MSESVPGSTGNVPLPKAFEDLKKKYQQFLSKRDVNRSMWVFWETSPTTYHDPKGLIELSTGMPNELFFQIDSINLNLLKSPQDPETTSVEITKKIPRELPLARSLQYSEVKGLPPLIDLFKQFARRLNNVPLYGDALWDVLITSGSTDSMFKIFEVFADEETTVLVEELTFVPVVSIIQSTGAKVVPTRINFTDSGRSGLDADYLENLLSNWETGPYKHLSRPRILYTIPTGQNPTGVTIDEETKAKVYELARRFDFLIVEDDPYGYLSLTKYDPENPTYNSYTDNPQFGLQEYISKCLFKSFLRYDVDGRVIRLETLSKIFAPGIRTAFVIANSFIIERLLNYQEVSNRQASGLSQQAIYSTITSMGESAGNGDCIDGWLKWIMKLAALYTERRNVMLHALYESMSYRNGYFTVVEPSAGMFICIKINLGQIGIRETVEGMDRILAMFDKHGVRGVLGYKMAVDREFSRDKLNFFRLTISFAATPEVLVEAVRRMDVGLLEYFSQ